MLTGCVPLSSTEDSANGNEVASTAGIVEMSDDDAAVQETEQPEVPSTEESVPEGAVTTHPIIDQMRDRLEQYERQLDPYRHVVEMGETYSLRNMEDAPIVVMTPTGDSVDAYVTRFVPWTGTLEVTFRDAFLYDSLEDAQGVWELGDVLDADPPRKPGGTQATCSAN